MVLLEDPAAAPGSSGREKKYPYFYNTYEKSPLWPQSNPGCFAG